MQLNPPGRPRLPGGELLEPVLPGDLTLLNDMKLGRLYGQFCAMVQYIHLHLASTTVAAAVAKRQEKLVRAETRMKARPGKGEVSTLEVHPDIERATFKVVVTEGVETYAKAALESYLIGKDALSRELTRRQMVFKPER